MRKFLLVALLIGTAVPVWAAEEPSGCDKFKWPIDDARKVLTAPDRVTLASGGDLAAVPSTGITLSLVSPADAKLPSPPERAPKDGTMAGVALAVFDDRHAFAPTEHIWVSEKMAWVTLEDGLPQYPQTVLA